MNSPVLFYSTKCPHCKEILSMLQNTNLNIKTISIEKLEKMPSFLKVVPTIITDTKSPPITGSKVFDWFNTFTNTNTTIAPQSTPTPQTQQAPPSAPNTDGDIVPFFNNEMSGFSDSYSYIGNDAPINHSYQFLNESSQKSQPAQELQGGTSDIKTSVKEKEFKKQYDSMLESRKTDSFIPTPLKRV